MKGSLMALAILFGLAPLRGQERLHRIPSPVKGLKLLLRQRLPERRGSEPPVLILHGATFPSANAAAWKGQGPSWMEALAASGREAWALDFLGYGGSDRYPEMDRDPAGPPLGPLPLLVAQVEAAVARIAGDGGRVDLVAHSAGTLVAGRYAELHPERVRRLVLFGAPGPQAPRAVEGWPAYFRVSAEDQWSAWEAAVKDAKRWTREGAGPWGAAYLASDAGADARGVRVPSGLMAAVAELERTGRPPYSPEALTMPTLLILGEWDAVTPLAPSLALFDRLPSPEKRLVLIGQAGHRMHLEASRGAFFESVNAFLHEASR